MPKAPGQIWKIMKIILPPIIYSLSAYNDNRFGESAVWNSAREVIPGIEMKGCLFNFNQAVYRKIGNVKLKN